MPDRIIERLRREIRQDVQSIFSKEVIDDFSGYMTVNQASKKVGRSTTRIKEVIERGFLAGIKVDGRWLITPADLEQFRFPGRGRPTKRVIS